MRNLFSIGLQIYVISIHSKPISSYERNNKHQCSQRKENYRESNWERVRASEREEERKEGTASCSLVCVLLSVSFQKKWKGPKALGKIMFVSEAGGFQALKIHFCAFLKDPAS